MILFDSDTCIEILRGNENVISRRNAIDDDIAISFMTAAELFYGAERSKNRNVSLAHVESFILSVNLIDSDPKIIKQFAQLKAMLETQGQRIADADLFIAATAICYCNKLITGNCKHYERIPDLQIENWIR